MAMRILLLGFLVVMVACKRPSAQIRSTLTPATVNPEISDYSRHLKAGNELVVMGNEPFWSLTINPSKNILQFKTLAGDSINVPVPDRITNPNGGFRYTAGAEPGRLTAHFRPDSCVDSMSGQRFDYRVDVTFRGENYTGCGLSLRQLALLQDIWVLTELGGKPVLAGGPRREAPRLEIMLTESRVTGTTGCNRLTGAVKADTRQIQFGPLATTKMACPGDTANTESNFLTALQGPLRYQVGEGKLTLARSGIVLVFKKVD